MSGARRGHRGCGTWFVIAMIFSISASAQTANETANKTANETTNNVTNKTGAREKLFGAWHLVHIDMPGPDGKSTPVPQPQGMLVYTRDGHVSVQLMYPESSNSLSNEYVKDGYEASFGSYNIDEATHTLTHHVQGSNTRDLLVGKDLPRIYQFTGDGHLIIKSSRPDEHWSVTWEHY